jgi:hypothetical protein
LSPIFTEWLGTLGTANLPKTVDFRPVNRNQNRWVTKLLLAGVVLGVNEVVVVVVAVVVVIAIVVAVAAVAVVDSVATIVSVVAVVVYPMMLSLVRGISHSSSLIFGVAIGAVAAELAVFSLAFCAIKLINCSLVMCSFGIRSSISLVRV